MLEANTVDIREREALHAYIAGEASAKHSFSLNNLFSMTEKYGTATLTTGAKSLDFVQVPAVTE